MCDHFYSGSKKLPLVESDLWCVLRLCNYIYRRKQMFITFLFSVRSTKRSAHLRFVTWSWTCRVIQKTCNKQPWELSGDTPHSSVSSWTHTDAAEWNCHWLATCQIAAINIKVPLFSSLHANVSSDMCVIVTDCSWPRWRTQVVIGNLLI